MTLRQFSVLVILCSATTFLASCGGSSTGAGGANPPGLDVYVAGGTNNGSGQTPIAQYWKNGTPVPLSDGTNYAITSCIAVSGSDVYVGGTVEDAQQNYHAVYWKNGTQTQLPTGAATTSGLSAIALSNGIVYSAGWIANYATVWISNVPYQLKDRMTLQPDVFDPTVATGIFLSGSDVYVSGWTLQCGTSSPQVCEAVPLYWKNTAPVELSSYSPQGNTSTGNAIFISGSDIYIAGVSRPASGDNSAIYWKDGTQVTLAPPTSQATSIFADATDVYVAGNLNSTQAGYWDNGTPTVLDAAGGDVAGIVLSGTDIYGVGTNDQKNAGYWLNGNFTSLGAGYGSAIALAPSQ